MRQQGFALIVVIVLLLVISILGVIAMQRSSTDLSVATAGQVDKLLFQANNIAFSKLEEENRKDIQAGTVGSRATLLGYMKRPGQHYVGAETVLCLKNDADKLFNLNQITEKNAQGDPISGSADRGVCDAKNNSHYVSEGRIMTQMVFRKIAEHSGDHQVFSGQAIGTSSDDLSSSAGDVALCSYFDAHTVSLLPKYNNATKDQINACLKLPIEITNSTDQKYTQTVGECLTGLGVPHNIQVQTYRGQPTSIQCI